jgi:hypothetical protein
VNTKDVNRKVEGMVEALHYAAVDNEYGDCDACRFSNRSKQPHGEWLCECAVPDPKDCPVVEQIVAALYNHVMTVVKGDA